MADLPLPPGPSCRIPDGLLEPGVPVWGLERFWTRSELMSRWLAGTVNWFVGSGDSKWTVGVYLQDAGPDTFKPGDLRLRGTGPGGWIGLEAAKRWLLTGVKVKRHHRATIDADTASEGYYVVAFDHTSDASLKVWGEDEVPSLGRISKGPEGEAAAIFAVVDFVLASLEVGGD